MDPERDPRQQHRVTVDSVYGKQHGLQPLDPSVFIDTTTLVHPTSFFMHWEQTTEHQIPLDADLPVG